MKGLLSRTWISALILFVSAGVAGAQTTANFYLSGANSGALAGVYTSPYTGSINSGASIPVICDDFNDESFLPEDWTAYVTPLSSITNTPNFSSTTNTATDTTLKWTDASASTFEIGSTTYQWSLNQAAAYTVAAVLAEDILQSANDSEAQQDYSYALWELFDEGAVASQLTGDQLDLGNASSDVESAIIQAETLTPTSFPNVTIYSYDTGAECGNPLEADCSTLPPQEFITITPTQQSEGSPPVTVTPEPASLFLFCTGMLGIAFVMRRRRFGIEPSSLL